MSESDMIIGHWYYVREPKTETRKTYEGPAKYREFHKSDCGSYYRLKDKYECEIPGGSYEYFELSDFQYDITILVKDII